MVDREQSLGQGLEPDPRKKISKSDKVLAVSVGVGLTGGVLVPVVGVAATGVVGGILAYRGIKAGCRYVKSHIVPGDTKA